ncbi:MAG: MarR family winged helix-turn-helix transcriptional regulator [Eubacterium sp.]|nr:MarR family winged helix-turn-helix transcriptional regulator [Eubacterium sp.]
MDEAIPILIKMISDTLRSRGNAMMKEQNLTWSQVRVLIFVEKNGGCVKQKELEDHLRVAHPTVVGLVKRLEQNGFLETSIDPDNRRNKILRITEMARKNRMIVEENRQASIKKMSENFSEEEEKELLRLLRKLSVNMDIKVCEPPCVGNRD